MLNVGGFFQLGKVLLGDTRVTFTCTEIKKEIKILKSEDTLVLL